MPFATPADIALTLFTLCNGARIFAYLPQILTLVQDRSGAAGISCATWVLFTVSNASTVFYALLVLGDAAMSAIFALNTAFCVAVVLLTLHRRRCAAAPRASG
ncbi:hypothetical protein [Methylobacterium isbiliense]|jgi:uncharacterized protein with PQ loop repeat|uniref:PQ loop repeat protein n=1 Tax=Methylobacterium isbiliense TaxID=315478 RepID=A0ABQ4SJ42_9HYPH|nr:hypothetical protein [Methylobacterium isbiliense]MDN3625340.1 hypothetical protein [Methylobacterium isbiliense]GJE03192.1 hypothetical protein GMJLKIPL_5143 [Methylobacterium isbiliense]